MKKYTILLLIIIIAPMFVVDVYAQAIGNPISERFRDLPSIVNVLSSWIRPFAVISLLIMIVYAGFTKLTALGDQEKEKRAMMMIQAAIIGFIIIVIAPVLVRIIGAVLGIELLT
jgi:hypothetical protein